MQITAELNIYLAPIRATASDRQSLRASKSQTDDQHLIRQMFAIKRFFMLSFVSHLLKNSFSFGSFGSQKH